MSVWLANGMKRICLIVISAVVILAFAGTLSPAYAAAKPGKVDYKTIVSTSITSSTISLKWSKPKNAKKYYVYYKKKGTQYKKWSGKVASSPKVKLSGLSKATNYAVKIKSVNGSAKGTTSSTVYFKTDKASQSIICANWFFQTVNKSFKLNAKAKSTMKYTSGNTSVLTVDSKGVVTPVAAGKTKITIKALESSSYKAKSKTVSVTVTPVELISYNDITVLGTLDTTNCESIVAVKGYNGATVPQSFCYTGSEYIVAYQANSASSQYLKAYNEKGEDGTYLKRTGALNLGHANGLTFCEVTERIYSVSGTIKNSSGKTVYSGNSVKRFNTELGKLTDITMNDSVSGIAYDSIKQNFYFSKGSLKKGEAGSIYKMALGSEWETNAVDALGNEETAFKNTKSKCFDKIRVETGTNDIADQDIDGHNGIVFVGVSTDTNKKSNSYIDMYRVSDGNYLGSFKIAMGEIESMEVDDNGYLLLLVNQSGTTDYIWRTNINVSFR